MVISLFLVTGGLAVLAGPNYQTPAFIERQGAFGHNANQA
jgi:hypothetical protein